MESTSILNVEHELLARNHLPAHDLEKGWVIDSGSSTHMSPFRKDCRNIQITHKKFSTNRSGIACEEMGVIEIPV